MSKISKILENDNKVNVTKSEYQSFKNQYNTAKKPFTRTDFTGTSIATLNRCKCTVDPTKESINKLIEEFDKCKDFQPKIDNVNHPTHYQGNKYEVIDIIEDYNLGFNLGNAIKYILRAGKKDDFKQDLNKAIWYLQREISKKNNYED